jgi:hypothetical protein
MADCGEVGGPVTGDMRGKGPAMGVRETAKAGHQPPFERRKRATRGQRAAPRHGRAGVRAAMDLLQRIL